MVKEKKKFNNAEIKKILKPYNEDIKRHMGALEEHFLDGVKGVGELCTHLSEKIDGMKTTQDSRTEMIGKIAVDMETVKSDIKVMKKDITIVKSDIQIIKTDVEPRVAHLEVGAASRG